MRNYILALLIVGLSSLNAFADSKSSATEASPQKKNEKTVNIELYTTSAILGIFGGQASFAVGESITIGPLAAVIDSNWHMHDHYSGYNLGVQSTLYLSGRRFENGLILSPFLGYSAVSVEDRSMTNLGTTTDQSQFNTLFGGATFGYQWVLKNGINFSAGGGVTLYSSSKIGSVLNADGNGTDKTTASINPAIMGNIGYVF